MKDNLDSLLRELNIVKDNNKSISVLVENKDITLEFKMKPNIIIYNTQGIQIGDSNGFFRIDDHDGLELIQDDSWGDKSYVFRDSKNKQYYGIKF